MGTSFGKKKSFLLKKFWCNPRFRFEKKGQTLDFLCILKVIISLKLHLSSSKNVFSAN